MLRVRYDDGSVADVRVDAVQPYNWRVGSLVECQWTDGEWYGARITSMASDGLSIGVRYEDGVNQKTNTGKCRSR